MNRTFSLINVFAGLLLIFSSCHGQEKQKRTVQNTNQQQVKESLIDANKEKMLEEKVRIDSYVEHNNYKMLTTATGIRVLTLSNGNGPKPTILSDVSLKYKINLLDGTYINSSDSSGVLSFILGQSDEPSGLQEALLTINEGSKALIIVPYYLAYGLTGDNDKIGGAESLVYQIELIKVRSN